MNELPEPFTDVAEYAGKIPMPKPVNYSAQFLAYQRDALRLRWLTEDLPSGSERDARDRILDRLPVMSYAAACMSIDAAMIEAGKW